MSALGKYKQSVRLIANLFSRATFSLLSFEAGRLYHRYDMDMPLRRKPLVTLSSFLQPVQIYLLLYRFSPEIKKTKTTTPPSYLQPTMILFSAGQSNLSFIHSSVFLLIFFFSSFMAFP
jgi:hypothetical protein